MFRYYLEKKKKLFYFSFNVINLLKDSKKLQITKNWIIALYVVQNNIQGDTFYNFNLKMPFILTN